MNLKYLKIVTFWNKLQKKKYFYTIFIFLDVPVGWYLQGDQHFPIACVVNINVCESCNQALCDLST